MTEGKLPKAQKELLADIGKLSCDECNAVAETYSPAKKLVALGYAAWQRGRYGSSYLLITDAGRTALREANGHD